MFSKKSLELIFFTLASVADSPLVLIVDDFSFFNDQDVICLIFVLPKVTE